MVWYSLDSWGVQEDSVASSKACTHGLNSCWAFVSAPRIDVEFDWRRSLPRWPAATRVWEMGLYTWKPQIYQCELLTRHMITTAQCLNLSPAGACASYLRIFLRLQLTCMFSLFGSLCDFTIRRVVFHDGFFFSVTSDSFCCLLPALSASSITWNLFWR